MNFDSEPDQVVDMPPSGSIVVAVYAFLTLLALMILAAAALGLLALARAVL